MSSDLKDARWQLAEEMAVEDGSDLYEMRYADKQLYLEIARQRLMAAPPADIETRAAKFRKEVDDG